MRVRVRRHVNWQSLGILALLVAPIIAVGIPALIFSDGLNRMGEIFVNPYYNTTTFLDLNHTRLGQMADVFEDRLVKYHLPLNYTCTTWFNPPDYETPSLYGGGGDTAIQTGLGLATQCFRYASYVKENNWTGVNESLGVIRNLTNGVSMLLAVPNGGIGPDFPGILARVVAPPRASLPSGAMQGLALDYSPFNGSGQYSQWKWDGATSKDQHSGVLFGLGMVLKFIPEKDAPDILNLARLCVDQLVHGFLQTGWSGIDGTGLPTGVVMNSNLLGSSEWVLCLLRLGATAYPEKYADLYYHFVTSEFYLSRASGGSLMNLMMDYYSNTFFLHVMGALILLEDDPAIREVYVSQFIQPFWNLVRYHRNAYFNAMYLMLTGDTNHTVIHDLGDQLMRFDINRFPERNMNYTAVPSWYGTTPDTFLDDVFKNNPFASIYQSIPGVYNKFEPKYFLQPRTVDMMHHDWFIWQRNPFSLDDADHYNRPANNGRTESHGLAFTAPYWIGRWAGVVNATGFHPKEAFVPV